MDLTITEVQVAALLKIGIHAVRSWRKGGLMPLATKGGKNNRVMQYTHAGIDGWLESRCVDMGDMPVPTISLLRSKRVKLLTVNEALARITVHHKLSESGLRLRVTEQMWPRIQLPGRREFRLFEPQVANAAAPNPAVETFTVKQVQHIFGVGNTQVFKWLANDVLLTLDGVKDGNARLITKDSVIALLRTCLPKGRNPYMWLAARLAAKTALISPDRAGHLLDISPYRIRKLAEAEKIPSLLLPGGERRFPIEILENLSRLLPKSHLGRYKSRT